MKRYSLGIAVSAALIIIWLAFFPPRFWLNLTKSINLANPPAAGQQLVEQYNCRACHRIDGNGALKAPNLAGITRQSTDPALSTLRLWLQNPKAVKPNTAMPNFRLSDSEIEAIVAYLAQLDNSTQNK